MPTETPAPVRAPAPPLPIRREAARPALDLIDEAFHRLRLAPLGTLGVYYAGTLPFLLALLYFLADQGHSADAAGRAVGGSLVVTGLFLVMKTCHAVFTAQLTARLRRREAAPWTWARLRRVLVVQGILQPSGLFALMLASTIVVPMGWVYAFYQNVTVLGDGTTESPLAVLRRAWHATLRGPRQNHLGLSLLSLLGFFVLLGLLVALVAIPYLLRMFTGEENPFTRSGMHYVFNTTFLAVLFSLTYLVLDPVAKAFYTLRCFYEESLRTGEDLLSDLAALPPVAGTEEKSPVSPPARALPAARAGATLAILWVVGACWMLPVRSVQAAEPVATGTPAVALQGQPPRTVSVSALGRSIDDVLGQRRFAWREPRAEPKETSGPLDSFIKGIEDWMHARWTTVKEWLDAAVRWIGRLFKNRGHENEERLPSAGPNGNLLTEALIALGVLLLGLMIYLIARGRLSLRAPSMAGAAAPAGAVVPPDLTDDAVLATQLPEDEWLRLAQSLLGSGERRLALRAFYLSALSALSGRGLLAIARHKSNRDYVLELRRRTRGQAEIPEAFARNVARFERVWYGEHPADDGLLADFQMDRQRLAATS